MYRNQNNKPSIVKFEWKHNLSCGSMKTKEKTNLNVYILM